jgi:hypothetical protein
MFFGLAEANTSAGEPDVISSASEELAPKLNFTVVPGCAASNCFPRVVNAPCSEAAAKTVIVPDADEVSDVSDTPEAAELPDEQPAAAAAARATAKIIVPIPRIVSSSSAGDLANGK